MLSVEQINNLEAENEELRQAYNNILTACKKEQSENEKLKKIIRMNAKSITFKYANSLEILKQIRDMINFGCKCDKENTCNCHVCDKYDAMIYMIDGALKEDAGQ